MILRLTKKYSRFLSHLSGDEESIVGCAQFVVFLSHLSGDEEGLRDKYETSSFLSHLSGDEEELYLKKISYSKA